MRLSLGSMLVKRTRGTSPDRKLLSDKDMAEAIIIHVNKLIEEDREKLTLKNAKSTVEIKPSPPNFENLNEPNNCSYDVKITIEKSAKSDHEDVLISGYPPDSSGKIGFDIFLDYTIRAVKNDKELVANEVDPLAEIFLNYIIGKEYFEDDQTYFLLQFKSQGNLSGYDNSIAIQVSKENKLEDQPIVLDFIKDSIEYYLRKIDKRYTHIHLIAMDLADYLSEEHVKPFENKTKNNRQHFSLSTVEGNFNMKLEDETVSFTLERTMNNGRKEIVDFHLTIFSNKKGEKSSIYSVIIVMDSTHNRQAEFFEIPDESMIMGAVKGMIHQYENLLTIFYDNFDRYILEVKEEWNSDPLLSEIFGLIGYTFNNPYERYTHLESVYGKSIAIEKMRLLYKGSVEMNYMDSFETWFEQIKYAGYEDTIDKQYIPTHFNLHYLTIDLQIEISAVLPPLSYSKLESMKMHIGLTFSSDSQFRSKFIFMYFYLDLIIHLQEMKDMDIEPIMNLTGIIENKDQDMKAGMFADIGGSVSEEEKEILKSQVQVRMDVSQFETTIHTTKTAVVVDKIAPLIPLQKLKLEGDKNISKDGNTAAAKNMKKEIKPPVKSTTKVIKGRSRPLRGLSKENRLDVRTLTRQYVKLSKRSDRSVSLATYPSKGQIDQDGFNNIRLLDRKDVLKNISPDGSAASDKQKGDPRIMISGVGDLQQSMNTNQRLAKKRPFSDINVMLSEGQKAKNDKNLSTLEDGGLKNDMSVDRNSII